MKLIHNKKFLICIILIACTFIVLRTYLKVRENNYHAKTLEVDSNYKQQISFDFIGLSFPTEENTFVRIDKPVLDMNEHQKSILNQLGIANAKFHYTNSAKNGRQMYLRFADGKSCSFIWVLKQNDDRLTKASIEHEKYHALVRTSPDEILSLSKRFQELGFNINLSDYEEETAATLVEVLSIYLQGVPFESFSGSEYIEPAKKILLGNYTEPDMSSTK